MEYLQDINNTSVEISEVELALLIKKKIMDDTMALTVIIPASKSKAGSICSWGKTNTKEEAVLYDTVT